MSRKIYRYAFGSDVPLRAIRDSLFLAALAAEGLHGPCRVRLDAAYLLDDKKRACAVDVSTNVGRDLARIFTGFLIREFGESAFELKRMDRPPQNG